MLNWSQGLEDGHWPGNFVWTVDGMLVAIGVLEIGKQTLGKVKGKRRTERQWGWRDWVRAGNRRGVMGHILAESHEGVVDSGREAFGPRS